MKKVITVVATLVFVAGMFSSCKKDYTCTCTDSAGTETATTFENADKSEAEDACEALNIIRKIGGGSCKLD